MSILSTEHMYRLCELFQGCRRLRCAGCDFSANYDLLYTATNGKWLAGTNLYWDTYTNYTIDTNDNLGHIYVRIVYTIDTNDTLGHMYIRTVYTIDTNHTLGHMCLYKLSSQMTHITHIGIFVFYIIDTYDTNHTRVHMYFLVN